MIEALVNPFQWSVSIKLRIFWIEFRLTILFIVRVKTYLCSCTIFFTLLLIKLISFSQGFSSGVYGGMNSHLIFSSARYRLIIFVLWNTQLSAKMITFDQSRSSFSLRFEMSLSRKCLYLTIWRLIWSHYAFNSHLAMATIKLILKSSFLISILPGVPLCVQP